MTQVDSTLLLLLPWPHPNRQSLWKFTGSSETAQHSTAQQEKGVQIISLISLDILVRVLRTNLPVVIRHVLVRL